MDRNRLTQFLEDFCSQVPGVELCFLFGSAAQGRLAPRSDIDVAVYFTAPPEILRLKEIQENLADFLHRDVDLVLLNQASPILRMQVLKNGVLVKSSSPVSYARFFSDTISQYEDLKRVRKAIEENVLSGKIYG